jgi:ribonucleoside-diphosphate reductase alpha chain
MEQEVRASEPTQIMQARIKLPDSRTGISHTFRIHHGKDSVVEGTIIANTYPDSGKVAEIFVELQHNASTLGALVDSWAIMASMSLQYGTPLEAIVKKFAFARFEPSGWTQNPQIRNAHSILDYVARWLGHQFIPGYGGEST